jgi:hypothetical protein
VPSGTYTQTFTLIPLAAGDTGVNGVHGSIAVTSVPKEGFEVYLDNVDMGYGTPVIQDIGPGNHIVRLEMPGYVTQSKDVTVVMGERARADFELSQDPAFYTFTGFDAPVDMGGVINSGNAGRNIPVKWHLSDGSGYVSTTTKFNLVLDPSSCSQGLTDELEVYDPATTTPGLSYQGNGNWHYNWKTLKTDAGKCYNVYLVFDNQVTSPVAKFKFK